MSDQLPDAFLAKCNPMILGAAYAVTIEVDKEERELALAGLIGAAIGQLAAMAGVDVVQDFLRREIVEVASWPQRLGDSA